MTTIVRLIISNVAPVQICFVVNTIERRLQIQIWKNIDNFISAKHQLQAWSCFELYNVSTQGRSVTRETKLNV